MPTKQWNVRPGFPRTTPDGANIDGGGVHFSIFSRHAKKIWLVLFDAADDAKPSVQIELDPKENRTGDIWHAWIEGIGEGQLYLWKMDGPYDPDKGHRYDADTYLLDPYAKALTGDYRWEKATTRKGEKPLAVRFCSKEGAKGIPKCIIVSDRFDWQGDRPLNRPLSETIIYECHVRGLTAHPDSGVEHPGTFAGVVEKIPHFKELGITAIELLPVHEFSVLHGFQANPLTGERLVNYWGYNTVSFFAPNGRYSSGGTAGQQLREFKKMVRELHKAGIEVILDVVFNHTAEGGEHGPTLCFKGIDNKIYYLLNPKDGSYLDYTGCGNTVNCNHPVVHEFILSCLRYWVLQMHVDGFRFDLASVLGRDEDGRLMPNPPLLRAIEEIPILRGTKIIAEAWDAAGAYQVGDFSGRWAEWNGRFRDDVRTFWKGDKNATGFLATRLTGSADLYGDDGRTPHHSINFITSHDGFTLNDWASYENKHNEANGENNQDGENHNLSINHGIEGPTDDLQIINDRKRQVKNMLATLMLSLGTPMMLGGDEFLRTQKGNNNAYCQDNDISWFDWSLLETNEHMFRFSKQIIAFRKRHPSLKRQSFYKGKTERKGEIPDIQWIGAKGDSLDWDKEGNTIGVLINGHFNDPEEHSDQDIFMMFNSENSPTWFEVPPAPNKGAWKVAIDTGRPSPDDIYPVGEEPLLKNGKKHHITQMSIAVLIADCEKGTKDR